MTLYGIIIVQSKSDKEENMKFKFVYNTAHKW